jgi:hypothetical protein
MPQKITLPETDRLPAGALLRFMRAGGLRGLTEELVLYNDGRAVTTRGVKRQTQERDVDAADTMQLLGNLTVAGFFDMPAQVGQQVPDGYAYEITVRSGEGSRMVAFYDGSIPPSMSGVMADLRRLLRG